MITHRAVRQCYELNEHNSRLSHHNIQLQRPSQAAIARRQPPSPAAARRRIAELRTFRHILWPATMAPRTLFVWDFDRTVVLENTDTHVFERLAPDILTGYIAHTSATTDWTALMDTALSHLAARGERPSAVLMAAASATLPQETARALKAIHGANGAMSAVLSDANSLYIAACLEKHGLAACFEAGIVTNLAVVEGGENGGDEGAIRVRPYWESSARVPHGCEKCPSNMCKGFLLREMLDDKYQGATVVYVGDGGNDVCPALRVPPGGAVLPRVGFPLWKALRKQKDDVQARVVPWETPAELESAVMALLQESRPS